MYEIHVQTQYNAGLQRVFDVVSDHASFFAAGPLQCEVVVPGTPEPNGLGAIRVVSARGLVFREEIVGFEPPVRFDYRIVSVTGPGGLMVPVEHVQGWVRCHPAGPQTHVEWVSRFRMRVPMGRRWLEQAIGASMARTFQGLLRRAETRLATSQAA